MLRQGLSSRVQFQLAARPSAHQNALKIYYEYRFTITTIISDTNITQPTTLLAAAFMLLKIPLFSAAYKSYWRSFSLLLEPWQFLSQRPWPWKKR